MPTWLIPFGIVWYGLGMVGRIMAACIVAILIYACRGFKSVIQTLSEFAMLLADALNAGDGNRKSRRPPR